MSDETGELYFLGEVDLETKNFTNYVKIGLVRPGRSTEARIKEHQTGNPRKIEDLEVIKAPRVQELENLLHDVFTRDCVGGEWFEFTEEVLEEAINYAEERAKELFELQDVVLTVRSLEKKVSTKEELPADERLRDLACRVHFLKQRVKTIKKALDGIKNKTEEIGSELVKEGLLDEEGKSTEKRVSDPTPSFKKKALESDDPDLYLEFCKIVEEVVVKSLLISKSIKNAVEDDEVFFEEWREESGQIEELISSTLELISGKSGSVEVLENLETNRAELKKFQGISEFRADNLEFRLKSECGSASGIREVCTWKRVLETKKVFNEANFKKRHPDTYKQYIRSNRPTKSIVYNKSRRRKKKKKG